MIPLAFSGLKTHTRARMHTHAHIIEWESLSISVTGDFHKLFLFKLNRNLVHLEWSYVVYHAHIKKNVFSQCWKDCREDGRSLKFFGLKRKPQEDSERGIVWKKNGNDPLFTASTTNWFLLLLLFRENRWVTKYNQVRLCRCFPLVISLPSLVTL